MVRIIKHEISSGPIGLPFFGCFFNLVNVFTWYQELPKQYGPVVMFPLGPKSYAILINDMDLVYKLFKNEAFNDRPKAFDTPIHDYDGKLIPNAFGAINGKEWRERRKLFYNAIMKIADSKYMREHVQNNIKNKIICPFIIQPRFWLFCNI